MRVFVRGVRFPDSCSRCDSLQPINDSCAKCKRTEEYLDRNNCCTSRGRDCMSTNVLAPHGRLIDADALRKMFQFSENDTDTDVAWISKTHSLIDSAETVIGAEKYDNRILKEITDADLELLILDKNMKDDLK